MDFQSIKKVEGDVAQISLSQGGQAEVLAIPVDVGMRRGGAAQGEVGTGPIAVFFDVDGGSGF